MSVLSPEASTARSAPATSSQQQLRNSQGAAAEAAAIIGGTAQVASGRTTNPLFDTPQSAQSSVADMSRWRPSSGAQGALEQQASP